MILPHIRAPVQALAALKQLQEYEAAMGAGEAAEEAETAEEGRAQPEHIGPAAAAPALPKSRSQVAADVLDSNLAQLSLEFPTAAAAMEGAGGEAAALAAAPAGVQS